MTAGDGVQSVLCIYRVKPGQDHAFLRLLAVHWPTLRRAGLVTEAPAEVERATLRDGKTAFVERFRWAGADASQRAHQLPEVRAVWEPMGALCEGMEFLAVEPVEPSHEA